MNGERSEWLVSGRSEWERIKGEEIVVRKKWIELVEEVGKMNIGKKRMEMKNWWWCLDEVSEVEWKNIWIKRWRWVEWVKKKRGDEWCKREK